MKDHWKTWMHDFTNGTLVYLPAGEIAQTAHLLREKYDPLSAKTSPPHLTITQPFLSEPTDHHFIAIKKIAASRKAFYIEIGPAVTSPNGKLLWLYVDRKEPVVKLRDALHATGLFNTELPLTKGFLPHLTISEAPRDSDEAQKILKKLNRDFRPWSVCFDRLAWIVPDDDFVFHVREEIWLGADGD